MITDPAQLRNAVLKYLSYRPRSRQEITSYLSRKTSDQTLINQTISELEKLKLINDTEFADWVVASRSRSRPRGKRLLIAELKSKGIAASADTVSIDEKALSQKALAKKSDRWKNLSYRDYYVKASRFLYSRGFSGEIIAGVVKKVYNDSHVS